MKVLVSGSTGTLGRACVSMLLCAGYDVRAFVRDPSALVSISTDERVDIYKADILDPESVKPALEAVDAVIHCVDFPPRRYPSHWDALRNVLGIVNQGGQLVFPSNIWVYGPPNSERIAAAHPKASRSRLGELRADLEQEVLGEGGTVVHMPFIYGPGVTSGEVPDLFERAISGRTVRLPGNLDRAQEYLYIDDAARALIAPVAKPQASGADYAAPGFAPTTPRQFVSNIFAAAGHPSRLRPLRGVRRKAVQILRPERRALRDLSYLDDCSTLLDGERIRRELGWMPEVSYADGIRRTVKWMRDRMEGAD